MPKPIEIPYEVALDAGFHAANASMRAGGRDVWSDTDLEVGCAVIRKLLGIEEPS